MNDHIYGSKNITMCPDGKYRWVYELDMYKSSVIIKEVWRAMLIAGVIVLAFLFVINIMDNDLMEALEFVAQAAAVLFGIFLVLSIISRSESQATREACEEVAADRRDYNAGRRCKG